MVCSAPKLALSPQVMAVLHQCEVHCVTCLGGSRCQLSKTQDPTSFARQKEKMVSMLTSTLRFHLNDCQMVKTSQIASF